MTTFLTGTDDMQWLRDVHCPDAPLNGSAVLVGNEDWPQSVEIYAAADPLVTDRPIKIYTF